MIVLILGGGLGLGIVIAIIWALWTRPTLPRSERVMLGMLSGGIVWGGAARVQGAALCLGDVLFLAGVALLVWRFYVRNPQIGR